MRMIMAEFLKLRKRRWLFWGALFLTVGLLIIVFIILEILHLTRPATHGPVGGTASFGGWVRGLTGGGTIAALLIGAIAGTADITAGVFRDLVATGRSRWQLFAARIPGALMMLLPIMTGAFAIVVIINAVFIGSGHAPGPSLMAQAYGWVILSTGFDMLIALGFASLVGSRAAALGVVLGWELIASPLLLQVTSLGSGRQVLYISSLNKLNPLPAAGRGAAVATVTHSDLIAALVLVAWLVVLLGLGAWRTATRDA
jgi:ABC-type transport system involved in multi-copper enzyme maturation permease subunit